MVAGGEKKSFRSDRIVQDGTRLFISSIADLVSADGRYTRGHSWKLVKAHSTCDARLYFFSVCVLNQWNSASLYSRSQVKNQLEKIRSKQMDFFMDNQSAKSIGCQYWNLLSHFLTSIIEETPVVQRCSRIRWDTVRRLAGVVRWLDGSIVVRYLLIFCCLLFTVGGKLLSYAYCQHAML